MKKIDFKKDEVKYLKRNWEVLRTSARSIMNETLDFVMATVEKDLEMILDRTNKTVVGVNSWLKGQEERLQKTYKKKEEQMEKELEVSRMDDEGGAAFINTRPPETKAPDAATASEHRH